MRAFTQYPIALGHVSVTAASDGLRFTFPYDVLFVEQFKALVPPAKRSWDKSSKQWIVAWEYGDRVGQALFDRFGQRITIPQRFASIQREVRLLRVEYVARTKDRGDGTMQASAWCDGGWNAVILEDALRAWFSAPAKPNEAPTLFSVLGVPQDCDDVAMKTAYRRLVMQWHPDRCKEADAADQFIKIQTAYEILSEPLKRKKYLIGLEFERRTALADRVIDYRAEGSYAGVSYYRSPLRCGLILARGYSEVGKFRVEEIHAWQDITRSDGATMVSSWAAGAKQHQVEWV